MFLELKIKIVQAHNATKHITNSNISFSPLSSPNSTFCRQPVSPAISQFLYNRHRSHLRNLGRTLLSRLGVDQKAVHRCDSADKERWRAAAGLLINEDIGKDSGLALLDLGLYKLDSEPSKYDGNDTKIDSSCDGTVVDEGGPPIIVFISPNLKAMPNHLMFDVKHASAKGVAVAVLLGCSCFMDSGLGGIDGGSGSGNDSGSDSDSSYDSNCSDGRSYQGKINLDLKSRTKMVVAIAISTTRDVESESRLVDAITFCLRRWRTSNGSVEPVMRIQSGDDTSYYSDSENLHEGDDDMCI